MLDKELREMGPPSKHDNTMLTGFAKCPRQFYWFMRRLDQKNPPPYFAWGRAWGVALNTWHHSQGTGRTVVERAANALTAAQIEWEKDAPIPDKNNTFEKLEERFIQYINYYGPEEPWKPTYSTGELGFCLPLNHPTKELYYAGSIDDPIEWPSYGLLFREDKTTSSYINTEGGTDSFLIQWDDATQVAGYAWAFKQILGEAPFGAYMNVVSKANRKEANLNFARYLVQVSDWSLERFERDTLRLIEDIHREWERWEWPLHGRRDPINCAGGMGRTKCIYRNLCHTDMEPWELEELYSFSEEYVWRQPWAPWDRQGGNE